MTIALIEGGLASQMFGYAAARRLALKHGTEVMLDPRNYRTYKKFQPELHHFDVDAVMLTDEQADEVCGQSFEKIPIVRPAHLHFDQRILDLESPYVLMVGNYVSEDYFADVADVIRKDFTRVSEPVPYALQVAEHLQALRDEGYQPVAVHVRRGDYVTEAITNAVHGTCTQEYYETAFKLLGRLVERPWFVFFSNDPEWVEQAYGGPGRTVTHPPADTPPVEDMLLMASCDHNVIANSGYSWWGAWLNGSPDRVVIGPRPFVADRSMNTEDILCRDWISLSTAPRPRL